MHGMGKSPTSNPLRLTVEVKAECKLTTSSIMFRLGDIILTHSIQIHDMMLRLRDKFTLPYIPFLMKYWK
jgi:hypothetical protein